MKGRLPALGGMRCKQRRVGTANWQPEP